MALHDGIEVSWSGGLPDKLEVLAEGPEPRLRINKRWWRRATRGERQARITSLVLGLEVPGTLLWSSSGGEWDPLASPRLAWLTDVDWHWWAWLVEQMG